jgi:uncharacterized small protein (DUF1192 family)
MKALLEKIFIVLLTAGVGVCVSLSAWTLKSVVELKTEVAVINAKISTLQPQLAKK